MHQATTEGSLPQQQAHNEPGAEVAHLSVHVQDAVNAISQLQRLGLQRVDISIPKIVVLGEQSTGKSSVIEAISGIKTPRADDTCTRCPLFIALNPAVHASEGWSAVVSLQQDYHWTDNRSERFPGWSPAACRETVPFASTGDPNELETIIARAQLAILSPMVPHEQFLEPTIDHLGDLHKTDFSPNVVCITINQSGLPPLSLYDLPGIIGQAENASQQYLVKFVKDLVADYVEDRQALVLLTCSLENDIANSSAGGIARKLGAIDRCIGVLTKPDRLPVAARLDKLQGILQSKIFPLGHEYFVVKNLDQDEINQGLTHAQARRLEKEFFEQQGPWMGEFQNFSHRFGTTNLQRFLSRLLAEQITTKLPEYQVAMDEKLKQIETELEKYPEPPTRNAQGIIAEILNGFTHYVRQELEAQYPCNAWSGAWEALQGAFFDALMSLKPTLVVSGEADEGIYARTLALASKKEIVVIDSDDEDSEEAGALETPSKKRKIESTSSTPLKTPIKTTPLNTPSKTAGQASRGQNRAAQASSLSAQTIAPDYKDKRVVFNLDSIVIHLDKFSKSRVPGRIDSRVVSAMMLETLEHWELPLSAFINTLNTNMGYQMQVAFDKYFGKWQDTNLYTTSHKIVMEMLRLNIAQQRFGMAVDTLNDERENPYIFHKDVFNMEKEVIAEKYREARLRCRMRKYKAEREAATGKDFNASDETRLKKDERAMAVIKHEPYERELNVITEIVAYYTLAARRFHDAICMRIESKFFKQLRTQLRDELENDLGIFEEAEGHANAVELLAEQSEREQKRRDLVALKKTLLQGQQILDNLKNKKYADGNNGGAAPSPFSRGLDQAFRNMQASVADEIDEDI